MCINEAGDNKVTAMIKYLCVRGESFLDLSAVASLDNMAIRHKKHTVFKILVCAIPAHNSGVIGHMKYRAKIGFHAISFGQPVACHVREA